MSDERAVLITYLKSVPFLRDLAPEDLDAIAEHMEEATFLENALIFDVNDPADAMYIIKSGEVEVLTEDGDPVAIVGAGSFLGEVGLLTGKPRRVKARALTSTVLWVLSRDMLEALAEERPSLSLGLARAMARRSRETPARPSVADLQLLPLFAGMTPDQLEDIASHLVPYRFEEGTFVYRPNTPAGELYIVAEGEVSVQRPGSSEAVELYRARSGDVFGEEEVLAGQPRSAAAVALTPALCWGLAGNTLEELVGRYPRLGFNLARVTATRVLTERPALPARVPPRPKRRAAPRPGLFAWYRHLDASARARLIALAVLLAWLVGVALPFTVREAVRQGRMYANVQAADQNKTVVIGNSPAGVPLATGLELAYPTPTPTPPATPTPATGGE